MYPIVRRESFSDTTFLWEVLAPDVARAAGVARAFDVVVAQYVITAVPSPEATLDEFARVLEQVTTEAQQLLRVGRDPEEPLLELALGHRTVAAPAPSVHHLLVGEHGLATGAPVDDRAPLVGEPALEHAQEEELLQRQVEIRDRRVLRQVNVLAAELHLAVAAQLRLSADETASWILIVWVTSAAASIYASLLYRIPIPITWTIPGIIYLGALAGRFSYAEIVGANLLAGVLMVVLGALGIGKRIMTWLPFPIVMGMFAGSILEYGTRLVSATVEDALVAGTCVLCYLAGRLVNDPRLPPVGLAAVGGAIAISLGVN